MADRTPEERQKDEREYVSRPTLPSTAPQEPMKEQIEQWTCVVCGTPIERINKSGLIHYEHSGRMPLGGWGHLAQAPEVVGQGVKIPGAGPDAESVFNEHGAGQSKIPYRFDLVDGPALAAMAKVLSEGAEKYGANNWRKISVADHLNHLVMHVYAYLAGDTQDEHLSHIMCRAMFAQSCALEEGQ